MEVDNKIKGVNYVIGDGNICKNTQTRENQGRMLIPE